MRILLICLSLLLIGISSASAQNCGDVNNDGPTNLIDILDIWNYILHDAAPPNIDSGNVDGTCIINVADVVYYIQWIWMEVPDLACADTSWCDYTISDSDIVTIGAPPYSFYPGSDSFSVPIYFTNTLPLYGLSLGFHYSSNDLEITSVDTSGTVVPGFNPEPFDYYDSTNNYALITWTLLQTQTLTDSIPAQDGGLFVTLNVQRISGNPESGFDLEPCFVPPGGNFIFVQSNNVAISPTYVPPSTPSNPIHVTSLDDTGEGTLRWAIGEANSSPGSDSITFTVSGTITPVTELPALIDDSMTIEGESSPGTITIDGGNFAKANEFGLTLSSSYNVISGLTFTDWSGGCINISGNSNIVKNCNIGVDESGNSRIPGSGDGIYITGDGNTIGGPNAADKNIITSFDNKSGIVLSSCTGNQIQNNYIGLSSTGTQFADAPSNANGIKLENSNNNFIGVESGQPNYIADFTNAISIFNSNLNNISTNILGLAVNLSDTISNNAGMIFNGTCKSNNIGPGNVIAGSVNDGIFIPISVDSNNIFGNTIAGNGLQGIMMTSGATGNVIGGYDPGDQNLIINNGNNGIHIYGNCDDNRIIGNWIGGSISEPNNGNNQSGISIDFNCDQNLIDSNTIAYNGENGVEILINSFNNTISRNNIYQNTDLGIDLADDGVTTNDIGDSDTGPNNLLNYPEIDSVIMNPDSTFDIYGSASGSGQVEIFVAHPTKDTTRPIDPTGYGEAYIYSAFAPSDVGGGFVCTVDDYIPFFSIMTSTFTDTLGNTSEFSENFMLIPSPFIVVAYSPVNLKITDPNGFYIGKDAFGTLDQTLFPATYDEIINDSITIPNPIDGQYLIEVIAEDGTPPGETYSMGIQIDGSAQCVIILNATVPITGTVDTTFVDTDEYGFYENGDANGNAAINILDVTFLINYLYKSGPAPIPESAGDANCSGSINILDATYLINYLYKSGPPPCFIE